MLKDIPIYFPLNPIEGILIKGKTLEHNFYTHKLEQQAHKRAKRILNEAEQEAESLRLYAYQDGYEQGMICALQQVSSYLVDSQTMYWEWLDKLQSYARDMFSAAVDHPETFLIVLDEWLRDFNKPKKQLFLTLPENAKNEHAKLMSLLRENWSGTINIEYHNEQSFVIRSDDQIAEFSPEKFVENAVGSLKYHLDKLPQDCRTISDGAINSLIETWKSKISMS